MKNLIPFILLVLITLTGAYDVLLVAILAYAFIEIVLYNKKYRWLKDKIEDLVL